MIVLQVVFAFVVAFFCHGAMLLSKTVGIDTEKAMLGLDAYAIQGRPAILWIRKIYDFGSLHLQYNRILTFVLLVVSAVVYLLLLRHYCDEKKTVKYAGFPFLLFWIVSPFWVAQLYFLSQSVPVLLTLALLPGACLLTDLGITKPKKYWWGIPAAIGIIYLSISVYQVQVTLYALAVLVVFYLKSRAKRFANAKEAAKWIAVNVAVIMAAMLIYYVITKLFFFSGESYFSSQILWFRLGIRRGVEEVWKRAWEAAFGKNLFNYSFFPVCVLLLITSGINLFTEEIFTEDSRKGKGKRIGKGIFLLFAEFLMTLIPYAFIVFYGGGVTPRMCYPFPITEACLLFLMTYELQKLYNNPVLKDKKKTGIILNVIVVLAALFLLADAAEMLRTSNRLYYTEEYVNAQDLDRAKKVKADLEAYIGENGLDGSVYDHVIFLGKPQTEYDSVCIPDRGGATIGGSFWEWDQLFNFYRERIYLFMEVNGYAIPKPYLSEIEEKVYYFYFEDYFGEEVEAMPAYPQDGYIRYLHDEETGLWYLAVKLGYDWNAEIEANKEIKTQGE